MNALSKVLAGLVCGAGLILDASQSRAQSPSRFAYSGRDAHMIRAIQIADSMLNDAGFWTAIRTHPQQEMDSTSYTMAKLAETLQSFRQPIPIRHPYFNFHFIATAETGDDGISIFSKSYRTSDRWLAITMIHEWVHAVDWALNTPLKFGHLDDQEPCVSRNTASYRIEQVAVDLIGRKFLGETEFRKRYKCDN